MIKLIKTYLKKRRERKEILFLAKSNYISYRWLLMSTKDTHDIFLMNVNSSAKIYNTNKFWYQKPLPIVILQRG